MNLEKESQLTSTKMLSAVGEIISNYPDGIRPVSLVDKINQKFAIKLLNPDYFIRRSIDAFKLRTSEKVFVIEGEERKVSLILPSVNAAKSI